MKRKLLLCTLLFLFISSVSFAAYDFENIPVRKLGQAGWIWNKMDGAYFQTDRPTMVYIHGASGQPDAVGYKGDLWKNWNVATFKWTGTFNFPINAYNSHHHHLLNKSLAAMIADALLQIIEEQDYRNQEIRIVAYSWGIHPGAFAAKKLVAALKNSNRNILVTMDIVDPMPITFANIARWLPELSAIIAGNILSAVTDDEGKSGEPWQHIKRNLEYVVNNQTVGIRRGCKLFDLVLAHNYVQTFSRKFMKKILPSIYTHVRILQDPGDNKWIGKWVNGVWKNSYNPAWHTEMPIRHERCHYAWHNRSKYPTLPAVYNAQSIATRKERIFWWQYNSVYHGPYVWYGLDYYAHQCPQWGWIRKTSGYWKWVWTGWCRGKWVWQTTYYYIWGIQRHVHKVNCGKAWHRHYQYEVWKYNRVKNRFRS